MIESFIIELLQTNNRVIIPDFGAFMIKVDAGKRTITFNDFLKYNDGLLVNYVATKQQISKEDAIKRVQELVKKLQDTLASARKYTIEGLGTLVKDERGGIRFQTGDTPQSQPQSAPAQQPQTPQAPAAPQAPKPQPQSPASGDAAKPTAAGAPPVPPTTTKTPAEQPQGAGRPAPGRPATPEAPKGPAPKAVKGEGREDRNHPASKSPVFPTQPKAKPTPPPTPTPPPQPTPPPAPRPVQPTPPPPPAPPTPAPKKSKTSLIFIIIGVVVVLGVVGVLGYFKWQEKEAEKQRIAELKIQRELALKAEQDSIREAQRVQDSIRLAEEEAARLAEIEKNQKKYYLVAGSFKVQRNAEQFAAQLKDKGYNAEVFMEKHGFWRVSYSSFVNRSDAFSEYQRMRQGGTEVWVIRH